MGTPFVEAVLSELMNHSEESYAHSIRVWALAHRFSQFLDWPTDTRERFILAAPIHDAGKLFVSHNILSKPGQLTDEEWFSMRKHPVLGAKYLADFGVPESLCTIVACHHERVDGFGYPGSQHKLPMESMALAICDTIDAMCSTRCYRSSCSPQVCLKELQLCAGEQFDKDLVQLVSEHWNEVVVDFFCCESCKSARDITGRRGVSAEGMVF